MAVLEPWVRYFLLKLRGRFFTYDRRATVVCRAVRRNTNDGITLWKVYHATLAPDEADRHHEEPRGEICKRLVSLTIRSRKVRYYADLGGIVLERGL